MIPNPWLIIAAIVFLAASHGFAFYKGGEIKENQIKSEVLEATNEAIEQAEEQAVEDNKLVAQEIKVIEKIKIEYRYIREKANENIDKNPVYAECGLDADGLYIYNFGAATETTATGKPAH